MWSSSQVTHRKHSHHNNTQNSRNSNSSATAKISKLKYCKPRCDCYTCQTQPSSFRCCISPTGRTRLSGTTAKCRVPCLQGCWNGPGHVALPYGSTTQRSSAPAAAVLRVHAPTYDVCPSVTLQQPALKALTDWLFQKLLSVQTQTHSKILKTPAPRYAGYSGDAVHTH